MPWSIVTARGAGIALGCEEKGTARGIAPGFSSKQEMVVTSFLTVNGKAEGENSRAEELHRKKINLDLTAPQVHFFQPQKDKGVI